MSTNTDVQEAYKIGYEEACHHIILFLLAMQDEVGDRHNYYLYAAKQIEDRVWKYLNTLSMKSH